MQGWRVMAHGGQAALPDPPPPRPSFVLLPVEEYRAQLQADRAVRLSRGSNHAGEEAGKADKEASKKRACGVHHAAAGEGSSWAGCSMVVWCGQQRGRAVGG